MLSPYQFFIIIVICIGLITVVHAQDSNTASSPGHTLMQQGVFKLQEAEDLSAAARQQLQQSNQLRQQLLQAQRQQDKKNNNARVVAQEINALQQQGNLLRTQANSRLSEATEQLAQGMQMLWPQWITATNAFGALPLVATDDKIPVRAHNTAERSVHPGMAETSPTPDLQRQDDMSLSLKPGATQDQPRELDRSIFQLSRSRQFIAHIEAQDTNSITNNQVPINTIHRWQLVVSDLQGKPIENAKIKFLGHMPGHVHGLPTQPEINSEIAPGVYLVEGVKFQMQGWWVIDFSIEANGVNDTVRFNVVL